MHTLTYRVSSGETTVTAIEQRLSKLESSQASQTDISVALQLQLEDMEDQNWRNNVRLWVLPEAAGTEDLTATITAVVAGLLGDMLLPNLEFDRVNRALGPRSEDPNQPRDVICQFYRFQHKDLVIRKAWDVGSFDFDGASLKLLPDISRATLYHRALLRPLLDLARNKGVTYRWGFPLLVMFRRDSDYFTLKTPADLEACFAFLETAPIEVPDWLQLLLRPAGHQRMLRPWRS